MSRLTIFAVGFITGFGVSHYTGDLFLGKAKQNVEKVKNQSKDLYEDVKDDVKDKAKEVKDKAKDKYSEMKADLRK